MPRIAITATHVVNDSDIHPDVVPYTKAIERAGATWTIVPNDPSSIDALLASVDGVLVTGGLDVDPARYGGRAEHARKEKRGYSAERDAFEIALARAARDREVPLLGICRGLQVVNVAFGGTLIEDVREELGDAYVIEHRQTYDSGLDRADYAPGHDVAIDPQSAFARLTKTTSCATNSMHHQAARAVGEGLRAVGHTSDGVIEVLDATFAHPFFFLVQWHPEELVGDAVSDRLFGGLVSASSSRSAQLAKEPQASC
jgi:gamma-glutamyl-gamma-aminobutyrate hydrolase PuuD